MSGLSERYNKASAAIIRKNARKTGIFWGCVIILCGFTGGMKALIMRVVYESVYDLRDK